MSSCVRFWTFAILMSSPRLLLTRKGSASPRRLKVGYWPVGKCSPNTPQHTCLKILCSRTPGRCISKVFLDLIHKLLPFVIRDISVLTFTVFCYLLMTLLLMTMSVLLCLFVLTRPEGGGDPLWPNEEEVSCMQCHPTTCQPPDVSMQTAVNSIILWSFGSCFCQRLTMSRQTH